MEHRWVIVGAGWAGKTIAAALASRNIEIVGFVEDNPAAETVAIAVGEGERAVPILGSSKDLVGIIQKHGASHVVIAITHNRSDNVLRQTVKCFEAGIPVYEMPDLYAHILHKIPVEHVKHQWIIPHLSAPKSNVYKFFHDTGSYLISLFGFLFLFLPLYPFIAAGIKIVSPGPVLYSQERVGKRGAVFTLFKFRTMVENAENGKAQWAQEGDVRITSIGRFLRKFRLDELPQFINVLKGDMSLIGPRPERPEFVDALAQQIPFYSYRHLVRPGITGWAQVNYYYGNSKADALEKLQYDLFWIKNRSFWLDLQIIFKSIKVIFTGFGAV
jgi:exopolysaccharide biosynthesis polyprenyl glycosylphosphotransferase